MRYLAQVLNKIGITRLNGTLRSVENGNFIIENGMLTGAKQKYLTGQYIVIKGSILNDGLYQITPSMTIENSIDEEFTGTIYGLVIPREIIEIAEQVKKYEEANPIEKQAIISQSWGGWSESKATGRNGEPITWQELFNKKLIPYNKMFAEVII